MSYAREDALAARRLAEALRAGGIEVWLDENELRGGDAWDKAIRKQIRDCTLFIPVISADTQKRHEGYFRLEWHLAEQRSLLISKGRPFIVPVCVDGTPEHDAEVPEAFLAVQWMRLSDGENAEALVGRVKKLLTGGDPARPNPPQGSSHSARKSRPTAEDDAPDIPDYEMLRVIGRGSYGDVWLARGITGIYRAIKVVWRARFADAVPFEREFKGLKEFAAISLGESIQMALLHIGRNDFEGYFYYVMELADDAVRGRDIVPSSYVPLTLAEARKRRGRLPVAECVSVGVELARVLAGLHKRSLIHRDIKPSNIIFVGGTAKLADIGLVTGATDASTFVGTEGFVPPEGPGSPGADVFALGKLLYELSTGLDRQEFPKLPVSVRRLPDRKVLFELNEIVLRACERDPAKRYANGSALLMDLLALQAGRSMRGRRVGKTLLGLAAVAAILIGGGFAWWKWHSSLAPMPAASPRLPATATASDKSIAVLPFSNLSGDKAQEYFSDGITQEILGALRRERDLTVPGDTSCFAFKGKSVTAAEIGKALNVARLVEGSVRKDGNQVRISVTLTRAADGVSEDLGTFTEPLTNIFDLQEKLARSVVALITHRQPAVSYVVGTRNAEAYDLYLRARSMQTGGLGPDTGDEMVQTFEKVVALDPNYALAWARLAQACARLRSGNRDTTPKNAAEAKNAVATALKLAPNLAEAHLAMANVHFHYESDLDATLRELDEVDRLGPNDAEALALRAEVANVRGQSAEELVQLIARSVERDPRNSDTLNRLSQMLGKIGHFAEAERLEERARSIADIGIYRRTQANNYVKWTGDAAAAGKFLDETPEGSFDPVLLGLDRARMRVLAGDFAGAIADYERLRPLEAARGNPVAPDGRFDLFVAPLEARLGHTARAHELWAKSLSALQRLAKNAPDSARFAGSLALAHAVLGENAAARTWMAKWLETPTQNQTRRQLDKAELLTLLGDREAAVAELRALHENGYVFGYLLRLELEWEPLRADPKFQQLMKDAEAPANAQPRPPAGLTPATPKPAAARPTVSLPAMGAPAPTASGNSIAVLPFANHSGDKDQEYFSDGLTEEILNALARERDLRVPGRASSFSFKGKDVSETEIAQALGVSRLIEGSVERVGSKVRIRVSLTRVADNASEEIGTFTEELADIFALREKVARAVVEKVVHRPPARSLDALTTNAEAFDAYLRGRALQVRSAPGAFEARPLFERAVALDPKFALAWVRLAEVRYRLFSAGFDWSPDLAATLRTMIDRALELQPDLPEGLILRATWIRTFQHDYAAAWRDLEKVESLQPATVDLRAAQGNLALAENDWGKGLQFLRDAMLLDPRNGDHAQAYASHNLSRGDFAEADRLYALALAIQDVRGPFQDRVSLRLIWRGPEAALRLLERSRPDWPGRDLWRANLLRALGREKEAGTASTAPEAADRAEKTRADAEKEFKQGNRAPAVYGRFVGSEISLGHRESALKTLAEWRLEVQREPSVSWQMIDFNLPAMRLYARLGRADDAVALMQEWLANGFHFTRSLRYEPDYAPIRDDPHFQELMRQQEKWAKAQPDPTDL